MNIVTKYALAGASLVAVYAYACATPLDIDEDVIIVDPSVFGDGGVPLAGASGLAGQGGGGAGGDTSQGGTGGAGNAGTGGSAGSSSAGTGGSGGAAGGAAGTGGSGGGAGAGAGAGGAPQAGAGGQAGGAGTAGSAGTAGTGGGTGEFNAANCNFTDPTGCEDLDCATACPAGGGNYCPDTCNLLLTCVTTDPECEVSEADPLCAERDGGTPNTCTAEADSGGGAGSTQPTSPAFIAREYVNCMCTRL